MCGRFTLRTPANLIAELFELVGVPHLEPRHNVSPTQSVAVVRQAVDTGTRELAMLRWGLIPSWAKDRSIGHPMINARADGVATKPSYRAAFKRRRCLIVADGFYEWKTLDKKTKQPYLFEVDDGQPFAFAGLWERWLGESATTGPIDSCTLITTEANSLVNPIHDRMPVILPRELYAPWLDPDCQDPVVLQQMLQSFPAERMRATPVGKLVSP